MKSGLVPTLVAIGFAGSAVAGSSTATQPMIERMPAELETRFALSAAPPALREEASVYLLDPEEGYYRSRKGTSGVTCLVERTAWELADFRDDIYIPLCYDAVGTKTYLRYKMDAAALRARGMGPVALKTEIEKRYRNGSYEVPEKPGLSYMVAPVMRTIGPPDLKVHTMAMPHLMFYAPHVTNADIGAVPDLAVRSSLVYPFIDRQGNAEQSYLIQLLGEAEKARILQAENALVDELCAYRDVLCLTDEQH